MIVEIIWDANFIRFTVENLLKNIRFERKVIEFMDFNEFNLNINFNIPIQSKRRNLDTLQSPTIILKIETILWLVDFIQKMIDDLEGLINEEKRFQDSKLKAEKKSKVGGERKEYTRFRENLRLISMKQQNYKHFKLIDRLKRINLKFSVNFFKVIVFIAGRNTNTKTSMENLPSQDLSDVQGIQFMVENCWNSAEFVKTEVI